MLCYNVYILLRLASFTYHNILWFIDFEAFINNSFFDTETEPMAFFMLGKNFITELHLYSFLLFLGQSLPKLLGLTSYLRTFWLSHLIDGVTVMHHCIWLLYHFYNQIIFYCIDMLPFNYWLVYVHFCWFYFFYYEQGCYNKSHTTIYIDIIFSFFFLYLDTEFLVYTAS